MPPGLDIPPALGPQGQTTTATTGPSSTSGTSQKVLTSEGIQAEIDSLLAQKAELQAQASPGRTPEAQGADLITPGAKSPLMSDIASRDQSALATPKDAAPAGPPKSADEAYQDVISQALKGNQPMPPPPDLSDRAAPRFTSRQLAEGASTTPGLRAPETLAEAQDEASADMARQKAKQAQAFQVEQARIEAQKQKDMQAAYQEIQQLAADKEKNTHITSLFEDMSAPRRVLTALAVGLGSAAATQGHTANFAQQALDKEMDQDLERKKIMATQYLQRMKAAGERPEMIRAMAEDAQKHLLATQQAQLNTIEAQATQLLAPFPQAQQKLTAALAQKKAEIAKDQRDFAAQLAVTKSGTTESGHTVTTSMEGGVNGRAIPGAKDVEDFALDIQQGKDAARLKKLVKAGFLPTPDEYNDIENNANDIISRQAKEKGSNAQVLWGRIARGIDALPTSVFPADMPEEKREAYTLATQLGHVLTAKKFGQGIMSNDAGREETFSRILPNRQDSPDGAKQKALQLAELFGSTATKAEQVSKAGMQEQRVERAAAKQLTSAQMAKAPRRDYMLYTKAKRAARPTEEQEAAIKAFEATYGR